MRTHDDTCAMWQESEYGPLQLDPSYDCTCEDDK